MHGILSAPERDDRNTETHTPSTTVEDAAHKCVALDNFVEDASSTIVDVAPVPYAPDYWNLVLTESQRATIVAGLSLPKKVGVASVISRKRGKTVIVTRPIGLWETSDYEGYLSKCVTERHTCPLSMLVESQCEAGSRLACVAFVKKGTSWATLERAFITSNPFVQIVSTSEITPFLDEDDNDITFRPLGVGGSRRKGGNPPPNQKGRKQPKTGGRKPSNRAPQRETFALPTQQVRSFANPTSRPRPVKKMPFKTSGKAGASLSVCAMKAGLAFIDGFNPDCVGSCLPTTPIIPSQKCTTVVRGDAFIGTASFGFIAVSPCLANNNPSLYYTDAQFAGTTCAAMTATGVMTLGVNRGSVAGLPYTSAQLTTISGDAMQVAGRIVSATLRITYAGQEVNRGGLSYCRESPDHDNVLTSPGSMVAAGTAVLGSFEDCEISALDRTPCYMSCIPKSEAEMEYGGLSRTTQESLGAFYNAQTAMIYPFSGGGVAFPSVTGAANLIDNLASVYAGCPVGVIAFTGYPGSQIHFEYIIHTEYCGILTQGKTTTSAPDVVGLSQALAAAEMAKTKRKRALGSPKFDGSGMWQLFVESLREISKEVVKVAVPMGYAALGALLG